MKCLTCGLDQGLEVSVCLHRAVPRHHPILHQAHPQGKCIAVAGASSVMLAI